MPRMQISWDRRLGDLANCGRRSCQALVDRTLLVHTWLAALATFFLFSVARDPLGIGLLRFASYHGYTYIYHKTQVEEVQCSSSCTHRHIYVPAVAAAVALYLAGLRVLLVCRRRGNFLSLVGLYLNVQVTPLCRTLAWRRTSVVSLVVTDTMVVRVTPLCRTLARPARVLYQCMPE